MTNKTRRKNKCKQVLCCIFVNPDQRETEGGKKRQRWRKTFSLERRERRSTKETRAKKKKKKNK